MFHTLALLDTTISLSHASGFPPMATTRAVLSLTESSLVLRSKPTGAIGSKSACTTKSLVPLRGREFTGTESCNRAPHGMMVSLGFHSALLRLARRSLIDSVPMFTAHHGGIVTFPLSILREFLVLLSYTGRSMSPTTWILDHFC
jgi:hypothetical protein